MKPIIILAVIAIAVTGLGVGSLGNVITLDVQSLGVGEETLVSPITNANVKFNIDKIAGNQGNWKNVIGDCIIKSTADIVKDSTIYCKVWRSATCPAKPEMRMNGSVRQSAT